jgi:hypothetical protein
MPRYLSNDEVIKLYGDPSPYMDIDGHVKPEWEGCLVGIKLPDSLPLSWDTSRRVSLVRCHLKVAVSLKKVFDQIYKDGLWKYINGFGGCYNFRPMRASSKVLSRHSWGVAVDLDCVNFIPPTWMVPIVGKFVKNEPPTPIIKIFNDNGFVWGKSFPTSDPMHFEVGGI